jgi:hypothetical protein
MVFILLWVLIEACLVALAYNEPVDEYPWGCP